MSSVQWDRRVCWILLMCLALPVEHAARAARAQALLVELVKHERGGVPN